MCGWCNTRQAPWLNRVAIEKINNLTRQENIKMVFITGKRRLASFNSLLHILALTCVR